MPFLPLLLGLAPTVASWIMGDKTGAAVSRVTGIARDILGADDAAGIERASDRDDVEVIRALRDAQSWLVRDLIERGRPLARMVDYGTAVPLPAVVLAHMLYQDAGRADELRGENPQHDHPAFMPMSGRALTR